MQEAWRGSGGNLKSVYGAMLHNKQSWELPALKARQPFDYIAATLRAVDAPNNPDVAASFMVAQADTADAQRRERVLLRRGDQGPIATASLALASLDKMGQPSWMPLSPAGFDEAFASWITAAQLSARIGWAQTLAGRVGDRLDARALLARADWLAPATGKILLQAPSTTAAIAMFFASPDFNRR
jgi:uncharacterized protein (DUF1800 family)